MWPFKNIRKHKPEEPSTPKFYRVVGGTPVTPDTAMRASAFYSGVTYISTQIAKLPWEINNQDNQVEYSDLSNVLNLRPNPEMSSFQFRSLLIQSALIEGNGYAEIERDMRGRVKNLWPINARHVQVIRLNDAEKSLAYRIVGGALNVPGEDAILAPKDIYHIKNFYTQDGIVGLGLTWYASEALGISIGADKFANNLFANGGLPSGVLEVDGKLSPEAAKRIKESWDTAHTGRKTGGTAVLEEGIKYKPISYAPDVLQFLESRKFSVIEIARFLRVPPTKLYDTETSSYNNIEHANLEVAVDTLDAWARNLEMEADIKLLNNGFGNKRTELDLYAIFRGDMDTRSQYFSRMMQDAAITPNEIRNREGLPGYEGGDRFYIANNNFAPVDRLDELIEAQLKKNEPKQVEAKKEQDIVDEAVVNFLKKRS